MQTNSTGLNATVWGQTSCSHCKTAKSFLELRGYTVDYRIIGDGWTLEDFHKEFPGARTVPRMVIDGTYVSSLAAMEAFFDQV